MGVMTTLPLGRTLTVADLELMPDDGHRYELVDGALLVTPAPSILHQTVSAHLLVALHAASPPGQRVLTAPVDVVLADNTCVQPDLLVARRTDFTEKNLPTPPLLAVEILSPSTRSIDLLLKRERYQRAGVASYWVVDPVEPRLTVWELRDAEYQQVADVAGDDRWTATRPFPVTIVPSSWQA